MPTELGLSGGRKGNRRRRLLRGMLRRAAAVHACWSFNRQHYAAKKDQAGDNRPLFRDLCVSEPASAAAATTPTQTLFANAFTVCRQELEIVLISRHAKNRPRHTNRNDNCTATESRRRSDKTEG